MRERTDRELEQLFDLDGPGPARPADDHRAAALVAAALAGAGFGPVGGGGGGGGDGGGGGQPNGHGQASGGAHGAAKTAGAAKGAGGAKLALLGGGAALAIAVTAAVWIGRGSSRRSTRADMSNGGGASNRAATSNAARGSSASSAPPRADDVAAPSAPADATTTDDDSAEIEMPPLSRAQLHPAAKPDDLLARANRERAAHRWHAADDLYVEVAHVSPNALTAQTALVASAQLHLEHLGDPAGAAKRFRAALASPRTHALDEDARWGLAESARARRDAAAEKRALADFLAHHPSSPLAARARARLADLP